MNVEHVLQGIAIANLVVVLGLLTALLNSGLIAAVVVALIGWGLVYAAYGRFVRHQRLWIAGTSPHLRIGGVYPTAAEAVIEALRPTTDERAALTRARPTTPKAKRRRGARPAADPTGDNESSDDG